ncbi:MAG: CYTH domain-containing protein [Actinobacteria bacterium]|nr:CYTH domain-containing protein [Actinomycetota bacterium]MBW3650881.1 CYTH domain-containing protein [Actinomycetota bacterium]
MSTEVERKFLVTDLPDADVLGPGVRLRQGYIAEEGDVQVRVRISAGGATLTVKAGYGLARTEVEVAIATEEAEDLWPHTEGRRLEKVRHRVTLGAAVADVDVYGGALHGLCTAEVEFASEEEAASFVPPPWFGRDVTDEAGWDNASLARAGAPG